MVPRRGQVDKRRRTCDKLKRVAVERRVGPPSRKLGECVETGLDGAESFWAQICSAALVALCQPEACQNDESHPELRRELHLVSAKIRDKEMGGGLG